MAEMLSVQATQSQALMGQRVGETLAAQRSALLGRSTTSALDSLSTQTGGSTRLAELATLKDGINQGLSLLRVSDKGATAVEGLLKSAISIVGEAQSVLANGTYDAATKRMTLSAADQQQLQGIQQRYAEVVGSINGFAGEAVYNGINLLQQGQQRVTTTTSGQFLQLTGVNLSQESLGLTGTVDFTTATRADHGLVTTGADTLKDQLFTAVQTVHTDQAQFAQQSQQLATRLTFIQDYANQLSAGSSTASRALNDASASDLAVQMRQILAFTPVSLATQSQQVLMSLFG